MTCKKLRDGEYTDAGEVHNFFSSHDGSSFAISACIVIRYKLTDKLQLTFICRQFALLGTDTVTSAIPNLSVVSSSSNNNALLLLMDVVILMAVASAGEPSGYVALT